MGGWEEVVVGEGWRFWLILGFGVVGMAGLVRVVIKKTKKHHPSPP